MIEFLTFIVMGFLAPVIFLKIIDEAIHRKNKKDVWKGELSGCSHKRLK